MTKKGSVLLNTVFLMVIVIAIGITIASSYIREKAALSNYLLEHQRRLDIEILAQDVYVQIEKTETDQFINEIHVFFLNETYRYELSSEFFQMYVVLDINLDIITWRIE